MTSFKASSDCLNALRPKPIVNSWYRATIDVVGKHMSGLVVVKNMPDKSDRIVFMNEAGISFFDFEFDSLHRFAVKQIVKQLDRNVVINTLRSDFELMMGYPFQGNLSSWRLRDEIYVGKQYFFFVTTENCDRVIRLENGSKRRRKLTIESWGNRQRPDSIRLQHHTFDMNIGLRKFKKE